MTWRNKPCLPMRTLIYLKVSFVYSSIHSVRYCLVAVSNDLFRCIKSVALTAVALPKVVIFFLLDISEIKWLELMRGSIGKEGKDYRAKTKQAAYCYYSVVVSTRKCG